MDLSVIQKEILITLITLYHQHSSAIKGEEIAEVLKRNPGTVRNQMQALKALTLVEGVPGPKGGYTPSVLAYNVLNLNNYEKESEVPIRFKGEIIKSVSVSEMDFITLRNPDLCHALIKLIGSVKVFNIGDEITIGPTPVNKLLLKGEIYGKDEGEQSLLITIIELISLPKKQIKHYMSTPIHTLQSGSTFKNSIHLFNIHHIHGAPVMDGDNMIGIVTLSDIARGIDSGMSLDTRVDDIMTHEVVIAESKINLYEVIGQFKEEKIGRLVIMEENKPVGILTQSDVIGVFPVL